jgi:phosphopantetheine adenylyltransferase
MSFIYQHAILGGTFDHFHVGHEQFVAAPFMQSVRVTIGLVKSPVTKLYPTSIESYAERDISLRSYLAQLKVSDRSNIITLHDIYGTSLTDHSIDAIFVTSRLNTTPK